MSTSLERLAQLVISQLAEHEMRLLGRVVAVRRELAAGETVKAVRFQTCAKCEFGQTAQ